MESGNFYVPEEIDITDPSYQDAAYKLLGTIWSHTRPNYSNILEPPIAELGSQTAELKDRRGSWDTICLMSHPFPENLDINEFAPIASVQFCEKTLPGTNLQPITAVDLMTEQQGLLLVGSYFFILPTQEQENEPIDIYATTEKSIKRAIRIIRLSRLQQPPI